MIFIIVLLIFFTTIFCGENIELTSNITLWFVIIILIYNVLKDRYISLISMFIFGFIYIYFKEFLNDIPTLYGEWGEKNVNDGYFVIMFSFLSLICGYFLKDYVRKFNRKKVIVKPNANSDFRLNLIKSKSSFFIINILLVLIIFIGNMVLIIDGLTKGRPNAFKYGLLSNLSYALSIIAIINFNIYYKQFFARYNVIKVFIYTFPIFVLLLASGTRFLLLYGIIALISHYFYNLTNPKIFKMLLFLIVFGLAFNFVLKSRNDGFLNSSVTNNLISPKDEMSLNQKVVQYFTTEGMLRNAAMITDYTNNHDYTYGRSIGFLTYFWVPREIWHDKPTQLDHWLIRKYTNEYDDSGHSTASGFMGELYMDFGPYFILPILAVIGWFMSSLNFKYYLNRENFTYISVILNGSVLAWIFFSVRSILTSTFIFLFIYLSAYLINKYFKKWGILN